MTIKCPVHSASADGHVIHPETAGDPSRVIADPVAVGAVCVRTKGRSVELRVSVNCGPSCKVDSGYANYA